MSLSFLGLVLAGMASVVGGTSLGLDFLEVRREGFLAVAWSSAVVCTAEVGMAFVASGLKYGFVEVKRSALTGSAFGKSASVNDIEMDLLVPIYRIGIFQRVC